MRRTVNYIRVGYSSTSCAMYRLCKGIRQFPLDALIKVLSEKRAADGVTFKGSAQKDRGGIAKLALNQFSRRYIFQRITAFTDAHSGRADPFPALIDRDQKNPFDIEHIWANDFSLHAGIFTDQQEFQQMRDTAPALLLLPADINRSLQDKPYGYKLQKYASQHLYTASLAPSAYVKRKEPRRC
ncbi:hypothetical protein CCR94_19120 [Rhodoblastus sphagnicola]|uniref:Uncharacterized protein n=2 Tax=Rhodoblastus sphagnicola TaxID=333368 RepID=A0A2S6MZP1_9HYPH|nr:hypothetical protein CCR94_19120 [Rhodoblastus sphagnicola]